jgi:hypothetical protein
MKRIERDEELIRKWGWNGKKGRVLKEFGLLCSSDED